jgi:PAS domain S-box-containing protein
MTAANPPGRFDLLKNILDAVIVLDTNELVVFWNAAAERLYNVVAADALGKKVYKSIGFTDATMNVFQIRDAVRKHGYCSGEALHKDNSGREFWVDWSISRCENNQEQAGYLIITRDVTDRKQAEMALKESQENYSRLFSEMLEGFALHEIILDGNGNPIDYRFLAANPAFEAMTGLKADEIVGRTVLDVLPGTEPHWIEMYAKVALTGEPALFESFHSDLGKHFQVTTFRPVTNQFACIFTDITEQRRIEKERVKLEEQLQQAMKMEAMGRLAGGVAHDFNNLLTGIIGHVSLSLMDLRPEDPMADSLNEIKIAAERAAALTKQLLAFSRKQIIEPRVLDLNEIIASLHKMLVRLIGENIEFKVIASKSPGAVKVDPGQFEQILINLVVNARDAMPDGGVLIVETSNVDLGTDYCRLHPYVIPGKYVQLTVSDTGEGMSDDVKSHLFEPFFTTKPKGRGTGFGLATIYGAVKQAMGSIEVYSVQGEGTIFQVFLPQVDDVAEMLREESGLHQISGGHETILFVEDEDIVREIVVRILEMHGYNVLEAFDAENAIQIGQAYKYPIDLLMTDVVMPGMNGRQLAEQLVKIHPETKVLYSSGYSENQIAHHGVIDEGLNYIAKPFTPDVLAKKLRQVLTPSTLDSGRKS